MFLLPQAPLWPNKALTADMVSFNSQISTSFSNLSAQIGGGQERPRVCS